MSDSGMEDGLVGFKRQQPDILASIDDAQKQVDELVEKIFNGQYVIGNIPELSKYFSCCGQVGDFFHWIKKKDKCEQLRIARILIEHGVIVRKDRQ